MYTALTHSGDLDDADEAIRPLRDLRPVVDTIERRHYLDVQTSVDEDMAWGKRFYMKGAFLGPLSDDFVDAGIVSIAGAPSEGCGITLWCHGGAIDRVPVDATAFTGATPNGGWASRPSGTTRPTTTHTSRGDARRWRRCSRSPPPATT